MSEDTPPPNPLTNRRRVEFEQMPMPFIGGKGKTLLFVSIVVACGGAAAYMFFVQNMPWTDMRVIAPAIGALWFGLRLFMTLTPRD
jgi:hypothetical protein